GGGLLFFQWVGGGAVGLELAEIFEGALEVALRGVDAALKTPEADVVVVSIDGEAKRYVLDAFVVFAVFDVQGPEMGLGATETAEHPLGVDQDVDESGFGWGLRLVVRGVVGGEGVEIVAGFAGDDFGL